MPAKSKRIPDELRRLNQWVVWRDGYYVCPSTGKRAYTTVPKTWSSFDVAVAAGKGVALVLTADSPFVAIDLHNARDAATGKIKPRALPILAELDSYCEVCEHGHDLRVILRAELPVPTSKVENGDLEAYNRLRLVSLTGNHLPGTPQTVNDQQVATWTRLFGTTQSAIAAERGLTDDQVVERAAKANGKKFTKLWAGDVEGYDSGSEADLALLKILAFWTGRNVTQIERLFLQSGLAGRGRTNDKHFRPSYWEPTLRKALEDEGLISLHKENQDNQDIRIDTARAEDPSVMQQAMAIARTSARSLAKDSAWRASFTLARRLQSLPACLEPARLKSVVDEFCKISGHCQEEFWLSFLDDWTKVKKPEGADVLGQAYKQAREQPIEINPAWSPNYCLVASIAYYLAQANPSEPFLLPCVRLASLLGVSAMMVSKILSLLQKDRFIVCVKEHSYRERLAKEYRLANS